jgi:hypothetical protein
MVHFGYVIMNATIRIILVCSAARPSDLDQPMKKSSSFSERNYFIFDV